MKKKTMIKQITYVVILVFAMICLMGCGKEKNTKDTETQNTQTESADTQSLYLIVENNTAEESLTLYSYETEIEHYFSYAFSTQFKDKYGNYTSAIEFVPGRVVTIGEKDMDGYLTWVQLSDQVWEYEDIHRFSINEESGVFTIADSKYSIQDKVYVFSNGERTYFGAIGSDDILTVVGIDKKILSVAITTGHGTLALRNTELFEDSYLQLNNDIFAIITSNMNMELPEGTYTLKVANDGWGGTTEIEIVRGQTTEIDLDTLKGEGKKTGLVSFEIDVENVSVYIDNTLVDHTQPIELTYGTHVLKIEADGYADWKKYLSVNSEEATLVIELVEDESAEEEEGSSEEETETETDTETEAETETETETEVETETED